MRKIPLSSGQAETVRILAQELLTESNERGDQDHATVAWAVGYLLRRSSEPALSKAQEADQTLQRHQAAGAVGLLCPCGCGAIAEPPTAPLTPEQPPADHGDGSGAGGRSGGEGA